MKVMVACLPARQVVMVMMVVIVMVVVSLPAGEAGCESKWSGRVRS